MPPCDSEPAGGFTGLAALWCFFFTGDLSTAGLFVFLPFATVCEAGVPSSASFPC